MGTFSIWHWLIVLIVGLFMFGLPALAVARENSELRTSRRELLLWLVTIFGIQITIGVVGGLLDEADAAQLIGVGVGLAIIYPLYQRYVRRARDAGMGKMIAYLSIIPVVSIVTILILLFKRSETFSKEVVKPKEQLVAKPSQTVDGDGSEVKETLLVDANDHSNGGQQERGKEEIAQSNDNSAWSEEFNILYEYDLIVRECHSELEELDHQLSRQFREEIVLDRKQATDIRDRLKEAHAKKLVPYSSDELNVALAEARLLGQSVEEEFTRVVEVMGEDADAEKIIGRLKEKYGPIEWGKRIREISVKNITDDELVMAVEDMGIDRIGFNEQKRLSDLKVIILDRKLNRHERQFLELLYKEG